VPGKQGFNTGRIPRKVPTDYEEEYKDKDRHIRKKSSNPADLDIKVVNKIGRIPQIFNQQYSIFN